jgi:Icc-related predicted phosphoesterase
MKVLASADVHGVWPTYEWLLAIARKHSVDMIVLAGDLLGFAEGFDTVEDAQRHEAQSLTELLDSAGVPVLYIMGNDDLVELNSSSERVQSIHGRRVEYGRFAFAGYQYSLPFMGGIFEKPETGIQTDLVPLAPLVDANTVFVSHSPALGILDPGFGEVRIGSSSIRELLERRPFRAHIHGHSHAGFGRDGKHFNVAAAGSARTILLDLETMHHQVLKLEYL